MIVYLLLTGSITMALVGLDTGTAFGGMGSSRAITIGALAEPHSWSRSSLSQFRRARRNFQ